MSISSEPEHIRQQIPRDPEFSVERTPPQNIELEMCVLGGIMLEPQNSWPTAADYLSRESFYLDGHGVIFELMGKLHARGIPPDSDIVLAELRATNQLEFVGGAAVVLAMLNSIPSAASVEYHSKKLAELALLRAQIRASTQIIEECYKQELTVEQILDQQEQTTAQLSMGIHHSESTEIYQTLMLYWENLWKMNEERIRLLKEGQTPPAGTGLSSPFPNLDRHTGGFKPGEITIIAARTSVGKTALALNLLKHIAFRLKLPVLMFSHEMSKGKLVERLLSIGSKHWRGGHLQGVAGLDLQAGAVDEDTDGGPLTTAYNDLLAAPIYISESAETIPQIKSISRQHVAQKGVGLIIIDYLQLIEADKQRGKSREQEVSEMSRAIKNLSRELKVPIVLLSQLKRPLDARKKDKPQLSDLRESGAIEQDADVVMFLHNQEYQTSKTERQACMHCTTNPLDPKLSVDRGRCTVCGNLWIINIDLIIAKVRDGSTGEIELKHAPAIYWFGDGGEGGRL